MAATGQKRIISSFKELSNSLFAQYEIFNQVIHKAVKRLLLNLGFSLDELKT